MVFNSPISHLHEKLGSATFVKVCEAFTNGRKQNNWTLQTVWTDRKLLICDTHSLRRYKRMSQAVRRGGILGVDHRSITSISTMATRRSRPVSCSARLRLHYHQIVLSFFNMLKQSSTTRAKHALCRTHMKRSAEHIHPSSHPFTTRDLKSPSVQFYTLQLLKTHMDVMLVWSKSEQNFGKIKWTLFLRYNKRTVYVVPLVVALVAQ